MGVGTVGTEVATAITAGADGAGGTWKTWSPAQRGWPVGLLPARMANQESDDPLRVLPFLRIENFGVRSCNTTNSSVRRILLAIPVERERCPRPFDVVMQDLTPGG
jgi:hypothetical protein